MKFNTLVFAAGAILLSAPSTAVAAPDPYGPAIIPLEEIRFTPVSDAEDAPQVAVLFGDPSQAGFYVLRLKFAANMDVTPHYHNDELKVVSLVDGELAFGYGEVFDEAQLRLLHIGSIWTEPQGQAHFGRTGPMGATIEIHGIGPTSAIPVD